jgi:hypothetical protein
MQQLLIINLSMSRIFTKGNNFLRQLGTGDQPKSLSWAEVRLDEAAGRPKQIEASTGQTAVLTTEGGLR